MALGSNWTYINQAYMGSSYGDMYVRLYAKLNSQSPTGNTSSVSYQSRGYFTGSYIYDANSSGQVWGTGASTRTGSRSEPYYSGEVVIAETTGTVTHNSDGTKSVSGSATLGFPNWSWSATANGSIDLPTIDRTAPSISLGAFSGITASSVVISASSNVACSNWQYKVGSGSWTTFHSGSASSVSTTISGLSPATAYSIQVRATKDYNSVVGTSSAGSVTTLGGAVINTVQNCVIDATTKTLRFNATFYNASYTNKLTIKKGSTTVVSEFSIGTHSVGTADVIYNLTSSQISAIQTALTAQAQVFTLVITSYSGSTLIGGGNSRDFIVQVDNSAPILAAFTFLDSNSTTVSVTNNNQTLIQNQSTLRLTSLSATALSGASIASWSYSVGNQNKSGTPTSGAFNFGTVDRSGELTITVTVTDSRGLTATRSATVQCHYYENIKIAEYKIHRQNNVEVATELKLNGSFTSVGNNAFRSAKYKYKIAGSGTWSSLISFSPSTSAMGYSFNGILDSTHFLAENDYDVYVEVSDKITTTSVEMTLLKGLFLMMFRGNKVGINENNPTYTLDVQSSTPNADPTMRLGSLDLRETFHDVGNAIGMQGWNQALDKPSMTNSTTDTALSLRLSIKEQSGTYREICYEVVSSPKTVDWVFTSPIEAVSSCLIHNGDSANIVFAYTPLRQNHAYYFHSVVEACNPRSVNGVSLKNSMLIDLTALFGSGNEPITVAEFKQLFNADYYPYCQSGDFIVEQGRDGDWTYRKWNSGIAECWMRKTESPVTNWSAWGYSYEATPPIGRETFPSGLFLTAPCTSVLCQLESGSASMSSEVGFITKDYIDGLYVVRPSVGSTGMNQILHIHAIGVWK